MVHISDIYTVLHINRQVLFGAGNQSNHQNFNPFILPYKFGQIFKGMKQKKILLKKKFKMADSKKLRFTKIANSQKIFAKILQIGPWISEAV